MANARETHGWVFRTRFRRHAFGWRSQTAVARVNEAVKEVKAAARSDAVLGAEGAILFLERVSPALEQVDSSSGAIGSAVNRAIDAFVPILCRAPVDVPTRRLWLERLWQAYMDDQMPYIEALGDAWGELCVNAELASEWADRLIGITRISASDDPQLRGYFHGAVNCLSALLAAGRHEEILSLLELPGHALWAYRRYGVRALMALDRKADALRFAEASRDRWAPAGEIDVLCESILISSGLMEEAYERYGFEANRRGTHAAWFRAVVAKYPHKPAAEVLSDLVDSFPGLEGKWFAAAKDAGLYTEAIALANTSPCDPRTLTRAARDFALRESWFAVEAGMAALSWLVRGYGYDVTAADVREACEHTLSAAANAGLETDVRQRIAALVSEHGPAGYASGILRSLLDCDGGVGDARSREVHRGAGRDRIRGPHRPASEMAEHAGRDTTGADPGESLSLKPDDRSPGPDAR